MAITNKYMETQVKKVPGLDNKLAVSVSDEFKFVDVTSYEECGDEVNSFLENNDKNLKFNVERMKTAKVINEIENSIFEGQANFISANPSNFFFNITKSKNIFADKINSFCYKQNMFFQFRKSLIENRNINITVMGDSISTTIADILNYTLVKKDNYAETCPDGMTMSEGYPHRLLDMLVQSFPKQVFNYCARAIGGTDLSQWNTNRTFNGVSKTWIEHIKDTNADLLIIGFGMNHTTFESSVNFANNLKAMLEYIDSNFTKKPSICILTSPRSKNMPKDATFGSYINQFAINNTADICRQYATKQGLYVIDVNKISNIKRVGKSFTNPFFKQCKDLYLDGGYTVDSDGKYILDPLKDIIIQNPSKNFSLEFDVEFVGANGNKNSLLSFMYNKAGLFQNTLNFCPNSGGVFEIDSYANSNFGNAIVNKKDSTSSATVKLRLEKRDGTVKLFKNGATCLVKDYVYANNLPGIIRLMNNSTSSMVIKISNIKFFKEEYEEYQPSITETEFFGDRSIALTDRDMGGGGINHPTTLAIRECYEPALKEFVEDLKLFASSKLSEYDLGYMLQDESLTFTLVDVSYYYANISAAPLSYDIVQILSDTGVKKTINKNVKSYNDRTLLSDGEFGIYGSQIIVKTSTKPTGYKVKALLPI